MTAAPVPQKSPLDKALENAIADYLRSTEGQELIRAAVADSLPTVSAEPYTATTDIDMQSVIKFVSLLNKKNRTKHNPEGDDFDCLMVALEALMSRLQQCSIHKTLKNGLNGENQDEIEDKATRAMRSIFDQYKDLLVMMANNENLDDEDNKLAFLYGVLKDMKN